MWFMNKVINPVVRLVLLSPVHGMLSSALLLLTYQGRKTGRTYTLPVQYAQEGQKIYLVPGAPEHKTWWRNLRGEAPVQVYLRGKRLPGKARLLVWAVDHEEMILGYAGYLKHFPSLARVHQVRLEPDGTYNPTDLQRAAASLVIVQIEM